MPIVRRLLARDSASEPRDPRLTKAAVAARPIGGRPGVLRSNTSSEVGGADRVAA
jgi:hypothetical protein